MRCKVGVEDSFHALKDCVAAKHFLLAIVPFSLRDSFFFLELKDWILTNLKPDRYDSNGVDWFVIFGIAIWRLWFWRNQALFKNVQRSNHNIILDIMIRAENSHKTMMTLIKPGASKTVKHFRWKLPPENAFKLNTDGACKKMYMVAAGGLIRNANGNWVAGFYESIGISSVTNDELWGLFYGLDLAWKLGVQNLLVEVDSKCTIDLLANRSNRPNSFSSVIQSIKRLFDRDWHVCIKHIYREANFTADFLANFAMSQTLGFHFFHNPPRGVVHCLIHNMYGNASRRFVSV